MKKKSEYLIFGFDSPAGEERIYEMGELVGDDYAARYQEAYDWGGYSLHKFTSLEEAIEAFPRAEVMPLSAESCIDETWRGNL